MTYRLEKQERLCDGELVVEEAAIKLRKPASFYIAALKPRRGQEVIYVRERDPRRLIAHPGSFPDVTVRLNIKGGMATDRQHHMITHTGFDYTVLALKRGLQRAKVQPQGERLEHAGGGTLFGRPVEWVRMHAGTAAPRQVEAKKGEALLDFADRVEQDAYVILCANPDLDGLDETLSARAYTVPYYYASKTEIAVDRETHLPLRLAFYEPAERLYERYDFMDVVIDPPPSDSDFDPDNPAYDF
ncbi:MAG: DUF1571 domain-containing protein [Deltaproteobacteria bacterium]|nr:DUF1571 domain-containing protein [Deltaproteobacteria bacterium]